MKFPGASITVTVNKWTSVRFFHAPLSGRIDSAGPFMKHCHRISCWTLFSSTKEKGKSLWLVVEMVFFFSVGRLWFVGDWKNYAVRFGCCS